MTENQVPQNTNRRADLDGLRALACLLVVVYHLWTDRVSGGLDVFFVLAGFFITSMALKQREVGGSTGYVAYLRRLVLRLLPSVVIMVIVTLVSTLLWLPATSRREMVSQAIASVLYFQNWHLAFNSVDYLAPTLGASPFQHMWALSVQGQFYLVWPLVMAALLWGAGRRFGTVPLASGFALLLMASLTYAVIASRGSQEFVYFSSLARLWEFALGAFVAVVLTQVSLPPRVAKVLGAGGIVAIVGTGVVVDPLLFPGYGALLPALGTIGVIVAGASGAQKGANRLLESGTLRWLGELAFGIYLWHWPILIITLEVQKRSVASPLTGLGIIALAVAFAWATNRGIERPLLRLRSSVAPRRVALTAWAILAAVAAVVVSGLTALHIIDSRAADEREEVRQMDGDWTWCFGADALHPDNFPCHNPLLEGLVYPSEDPDSDFAEIYSMECRTHREDDDVRPCSFGVAGAETRVALIGNSHAASWFPAFEQVASQRGWQLDTYFRSACPYNSMIFDRDEQYYEQALACHRWGENLTEVLANEDPYYLILTSGHAQGGFLGPSGVRDFDAGVQGYRDVWKPLLERGTNLMVIADYPESTDEVIACGRQTPFSDSCFRPEDEATTPHDEQVLVVATQGLDGVHLVELNDWFCVDGRCPAVIGNVHVYRDYHHFGETYARTLTPALDAAVSRVERDEIAK